MQRRRDAALRWTAVLLPVAVLAVDAMRDALGADPVQALQDRTGFWALTWLIASLAVSPLARISGRPSLLPWRRTLGLAAFGLAALHLLLWAVLDQSLEWAAMVEEVGRQRFIAVGALSLLLLTPLAITSTRGWMRRLGGVRWRRLHTCVYLAAPLALLHEVWRYKLVESQPLLFLASAVVIVLLRAIARRRPATTPASLQNRPS